MLAACVDSEGTEHSTVVKLREVSSQGCTFGSASLACELVCSMLARAAGLAVPDYAIVEVAEEFARCVPDRESQRELMNNLGENFGTTYFEDHSRYVPGMQVGVAGRGQIESILGFDAYVLNNDRKCSNPNLIVRGDTVLLIDHSLAFPHLGSPGVAEPWRKWLPSDQLREHCTYPALKGTSPKFEMLVDFLATELTDTDCRDILDVVPDCWQRSSSDDKDSLLRYLLRRSTPFLESEPSRLAQVCGP